jgi:hypothetical protein
MPSGAELNPGGVHLLPRLTSAIGGSPSDSARGSRHTVLAAAPNLTRDGVLRRHGTIRTTLSIDPKCRPAAARTLSAALLADKYGVPLPAARIAQLIDGRDAVRAHGTADMPVWERNFTRWVRASAVNSASAR